MLWNKNKDFKFLYKGLCVTICNINVPRDKNRLWLHTLPLIIKVFQHILLIN